MQRHKATAPDVRLRAKRRRRTAVEARTAILEAAERRLHALGPEGLKLQEIAADAGMSHPAILHHFGNREALVEAVVNRALLDLVDHILAVMSRRTRPEHAILDMVEQAFATLAEPRHARLLGWLYLSGREVGAPRGIVRAIADRGYAALQTLGAPGNDRTRFEDALFSVLLVAAVSLGMGISQGRLLRSAGLEEDPAALERFQQWLARVVMAYIERPGTTAAENAAAATAVDVRPEPQAPALPASEGAS